MLVIPLVLADASTSQQTSSSGTLTAATRPAPTLTAVTRAVPTLTAAPRGQG